MKWPTQVSLVRHGQSHYNALRDIKNANPLYKAFRESFEKDPESAKTVELAKQAWKGFGLGVSDANTRLTTNGARMSIETGYNLKKVIELPHVIFVSPYVRTRETLGHMKLGWPELDHVKMVQDDRIREQEHGLSLLYNDWRVFHALHPEQRMLRELQGEYWYQYPQGESVSQVRDRIRSFVGTLIREYSGQRVMLITHHLTILSIRGLLERLGPQDFISLDRNEKPINCGVTIYNGDPALGRDGKLVLSEYNTRHYA